MPVISGGFRNKDQCGQIYKNAVPPIYCEDCIGVKKKSL